MLQSTTAIGRSSPVIGRGATAAFDGCGIGGIGCIDELLDELANGIGGIGFVGSGFIDELLDELADCIGGINAAGIGGSGFIDELLVALMEELAGKPSPRHEITSTGMERASPHKGVLQKNILPIESSDLHLAWLSDEPTFPDSLSQGRALPSKQYIDRRRASTPQAETKQHINRRRASTPDDANTNQNISPSLNVTRGIGTQTTRKQIVVVFQVYDTWCRFRRRRSSS